MFCAFFNAQNHYIVYDKIIDVTGGFEKVQEKNILVFDQESSLFFSYNGKFDEIQEFLNNDVKIRSSKIIKNVFKENEYLIKDNSFTREILFTIDHYLNYNWKIASDKPMKILGFNCIKATGEARGRKYEAWFTKEIPSNVGPWKFNGLPGTVLKVREMNSLITYEAVKIVLNKPFKQEISSKLSFQFPENKSEFLQYQQYINKENDYKRNIREKISSNRPIGVKVISISGIREFELEKSFEWENPKTKE